MDLTGRHFLKLLDYTPEEINYLIDLAAELKRLKKAGIPVDTLRGKNVALIFEKDSFLLLSDILESAGELSEKVPYEQLVTTDFAKKAASH